jgi:predicted secreted protein
MYWPEGRSKSAESDGLKTLKRDESDDGSEVKLVPGQRLVATLKSNRPTGFRWQSPDVNEGVIELLERTYESMDKQSDKLGRPGRTTFRFRARKPGKAELEMAYSQPWEGGQKQKRTFSLTVTVVPEKEASQPSRGQNEGGG